MENALQALRVASGGEGVGVDEVMVDDGDMVTATGTMIVPAPPAEGANGRRGGKGLRYGGDDGGDDETRTILCAGNSINRCC